MKLEESNLNCQIPTLKRVAEGEADIPPASILRHIKLFVRRRMHSSQERVFKKNTNSIMNWINRLRGKSLKPSEPILVIQDHLKAGDLVRVRTLEQIQATLNHWHQLKGLTFMPEMRVYCGTQHVVLKHMRRFVDERDLQVKKSSGIILLERVMCQGTADFGSCDRSCFYFWREEWLEKIDTDVTQMGPVA